MKIYIVGGYVRDRLLGRPCKDHDFVVVGGSPQEMIDRGFKQVGADFPVFLHPESGDEYALARTERKTGKGYHGFEVAFDRMVTLEDDLRRRDLTINAMAREVVGWNEQGHAKLSDEIIDPFGGQKDLKMGVLRHVSHAFAEDPLRVLRVARFSARYGFSVAPETYELMLDIAESGELKHLTAERVSSEVRRAIMEPYPQRFFTTLEDCEALKQVLGLEYDDVRAPCRARLISAAQLDAEEWERWLAFFAFDEPERAAKLMESWMIPQEIRQMVELATFISSAVICGPREDGKSVADNLEQLFRRFRLGHPENFVQVQRVMRASILFCEWKRRHLIDVLLVLQDAARVEVSDPSLEGRAYGEDLQRQRYELFRKYEYAI